MMGDVARRTLPNDATGRFRPSCWPGSSIFHRDKTFSLQLQYTSSLYLFFTFLLIFIVVPHGKQGMRLVGGLFPELCGSNFVVSQPDVREEESRQVSE